VTQQSRRERRRQRQRSTVLRRACEGRLAALGLSYEPDVLRLTERLSERRGRPIVLVPLQMRAFDPCGVWFASVDTDFICYEANTSKHHQEHIIAHELGHMICCHRGLLAGNCPAGQTCRQATPVDGLRYHRPGRGKPA
jgi:Zn-dependent peptidase ImmA (M78 family)